MPDTPFDPLAPLQPKAPPLVPVEALLAVGEVTLAAGAVPRGVLREFYVHVLGLTFVWADGDVIQFSHDRRQIRLDRGHAEPGRLGLLTRGFGAAVLRLRGRSVPFEILHTDGGLTRMAYLRDPAGNLIHLVETRRF
jgi:hypothetical protein